MPAFDLVDLARANTRVMLAELDRIVKEMGHDGIVVRLWPDGQIMEGIPPAPTLQLRLGARTSGGGRGWCRLQ